MYFKPSWISKSARVHCSYYNFVGKKRNLFLKSPKNRIFPKGLTHAITSPKNRFFQRGYPMLWSQNANVFVYADDSNEN